MIWEKFSWESLGPLVEIKQTLNTTDNLKIIVDQLHPYISSNFLIGNGMTQQDNALCHKARTVFEWFQEHDAEFQLMPWLPNSPDLNPMEHIWDVMERQLKNQVPSGNVSDLRDHCLNIWYSLSAANY